MSIEEMGPRALRLRSSFADDILLCTRDTASAASEPSLPACWVVPEVARWLASPFDRRGLLELLGLDAMLFGASASRARARLEEALRSGELLARRAPRRRVSLPVELEEEPCLGPESAADPDDFLRVLVYDSCGQPIPSELHPTPVAFDVTLVNGPAHVDLRGGLGDVPSIPPGGPSACRLRFTGIADADDPVPPEAPPYAAPVVDRALVRGPVDGPTRLARGAFGAPLPAALDATNVFQLARDEATVIELEHFHDGSAVFLPGLSPAALREDADRVFGLDALRACLRRANAAPGDAMTIAGHDAKVSVERARAVAALLTADRKAWIDVAKRSSCADDVRELLIWVAETRRWDCDPRVDGDAPPCPTGPRPPALRRFKAHYAEQYGVTMADDERVDERTWGAFFDLMTWALRPSTEPASLPYLVVPADKQTYPVKLAEVSMRDANRCWDLNPINPGKAMPGHQGWYPIHVGDVIYLPTDWDLDRLDAAGWITVRPGQRDGAPDDPALSPLPASRPIVTGCGVRHAAHPHADAPERRAVERHVEVLFTAAAAGACSADAACTSKVCELYDPRAYDFDYVVDFVPELTDVSVTVVDPVGTVRPRAFVTLLGPTTRHARAGEDGLVKFGDVVPGSYTVCAWSEGYSIGESTLQVVGPDGAAGGGAPRGSGGPSLSFLVPDQGGENQGGGNQPRAPGPNRVVVVVAYPVVEFVVTGQDPAQPGCRRGRKVEDVRLEQLDDTGEDGVHPGVWTGESGTARMGLSAGTHPFKVFRDGFVTKQLDVVVDPTSPQPQRVPVTIVADTTEDPMRDRVVAIAKAELAKWQASQSKDPSDPNRAAWPRLNAYFSAVAGWTQAIAFDWKPAEWCGIFAVWCVRMGAHPCASWISGLPPEHVGPKRTWNTPEYASLKKGDVVHIWLQWDVYYNQAIARGLSDADAKAYAKQMTGGWQGNTTNHHGIVIDVSGSTVTTIEGNTRNPNGTPEPKACAMSVGTRSTATKFQAGWIDFFYSIG